MSDKPLVYYHRHDPQQRAWTICGREAFGAVLEDAQSVRAFRPCPECYPTDPVAEPSTRALLIDIAQAAELVIDRARPDDNSLGASMVISPSAWEVLVDAVAAWHAAGRP